MAKYKDWHEWGVRWGQMRGKRAWPGITAPLTDLGVNCGGEHVNTPSMQVETRACGENRYPHPEPSAFFTQRNFFWTWTWTWTLPATTNVISILCILGLQIGLSYSHKNINISFSSHFIGEFLKKGNLDIFPGNLPNSTLLPSSVHISQCLLLV